MADLTEKPRTPAAPLLWTPWVSRRELDLLRLLGDRESTAEIAADMSVSVNTVRTHVRRLQRKLDVRERGDLVQRVRDLGLI